MKTFPVSKKVAKLFARAQVAYDCRDASLEIVGAKKQAVRFGMLARKLSDKAWKLVSEEYPDLDYHDMQYNPALKALQFSSKVAEEREMELEN
jgi:hypothetical protein